MLQQQADRRGPLSGVKVALDLSHSCDLKCLIDELISFDRIVFRILLHLQFSRGNLQVTNCSR